MGHADRKYKAAVFLWETKCRFRVVWVRHFALFIWKDLDFRCSVSVSHTRRKFFSGTATWRRIPFPCPVSLGCYWLCNWHMHKWSVLSLRKALRQYQLEILKFWVFHVFPFLLTETGCLYLFQINLLKKFYRGLLLCWRALPLWKSSYIRTELFLKF